MILFGVSATTPEETKMKKSTSTRSKKPTKQRFPKGWDEKRVQELIDYYDNQTDEEGAAEYEAAMKHQDETMMFVPNELVPEIRKLIASRRKRKMSSVGG
jgi:hypothetical protein